jgi:isocitrate dehydrogenase
MESMDAVNDVYEKIKWKREREMHAQMQQQQQQPQSQQQYEIRDPHGILDLLRSRL